MTLVQREEPVSLDHREVSDKLGNQASRELSALLDFLVHREQRDRKECQE